MITDFKKYNRIFAFGCSFTNHIYPTYADVLAKECTNATFFNMGKAGGGNNLICYRLVEANQRYKFNSEDLVVVMWTSSSRDDRFVDNKWQCHGNVYNNDYYDEDFISKYTDPNGYLIQSCAAITLGISFVKNLPSDSLILNGWPLFGNEVKEIFDLKYLNDLKNAYNNLNELPISLYEYLFKDIRNTNNWYLRGATYMHHDGTMVKDAHPNPLAGYEYLKGLGLPLTDLSYDYAVHETEALKNCKTITEILERYDTYKLENTLAIKPMFF